jgi:hypothetical protein
MPDLTTHLFFSIKLYNKNPYITNETDFLLGVIAPDCILNDEFIKKSHFLSDEDKIDTETLKNLQGMLYSIEPNYSFYFGYLTHLYLDYYFDKYSDTIFLFKIESQESKINTLRKIKSYNMQQNKYFLINYGEGTTNLRYEYLCEATDKLKDLIYTNSDFSIGNDFEELGEYISLIDRAVLEFGGELNVFKK